MTYMLNFLPAFVLAVLVPSMIATNTVFWFTLFLPIIALKLLCFFSPAIQRWGSRWLMFLGSCWVAGNSFIFNTTQKTQWDIQGFEQLDLQKSYLVVSNHRSWTDIFVLQHVFNGKIPFLKFFLKKELLWVPLLGVAWWALDFPFMKRYSKAYLAKHPEKKGKDMETTQKYCERFKHYPVSVINFLEGTRFRESKRDAQQSPYRHLLKPKAGGVGHALSILGDSFSEVLDVTLIYPENDPKNLILQLFKGHIPRIVVRLQRRAVPEGVTGRNYQEDPAYQNQIQQWVNQMWAEKEALIQAYFSQHLAK